MALTIVETPTITGGVDTHADVHVAAALDPVGKPVSTHVRPELTRKRSLVQIQFGPPGQSGAALE